jgi:hypothetical protein
MDKIYLYIAPLLSIKSTNEKMERLAVVSLPDKF